MDKIKFFNKLIISVLLCIFTTGTFVSAISHENCKNVRGLDGTLPLEKAEKTVFFKLEDNEAAKDKCFLDLDFMIETRDNRYDYILQINLNKNMIKEIDLSDAKANRQNLKVDIPKEYFKKGYNKLIINVSSKDKNKKTSNKDIFKVLGESYIHVEL